MRLPRDQTLTDINLRRADRVLLNDLAPVKKKYERFLVTFGAAVDQAHIGNEVRGLGVHSREIMFPYLVAAVGEGGLGGIAIRPTHLILGGSSLDQLPRYALRRGVSNAFIADAGAAAQRSS